MNNPAIESEIKTLIVRVWREGYDAGFVAGGGVGQPPLRKLPITVPDDVWITGLKGNPAYTGIDIDVQFGKAQVWCRENQRVCSRRFFVNWLNKQERPINGNGHSSKPPEEPRWAKEKRLDRIQLEINAVKGRGSEQPCGPTIYEPQDHELLRKLIEQKKQLKRELGLSI